jgi:hypothetical protein
MIDINKKYRTRAGAEVRIYALDGDEPRPVHGAFKSPTGWVVSCWRQDGTQLDFGGHYDLIEVKPRIQRTVWLALYPNGGVRIVSDDCTAVEKGCLACVKVDIDCEEGEGL